TRLAVSDDVATASRDGTLVLIRPVTTSTDGRWVASTRWIPAARAFWVIRTMASSTSRGAVIIKSASSSTIATMYGYGLYSRWLPSGAVISPERTFLLKSSMWRTRDACMSW